MSALTEEEKSKCRRALGYVETSFGGDGAAASISFGLARPVQTAFILEEAIQNLLTNPYAIDRVRQLLGILDGIEAKMVAATCQLGVAELGEIKLRESLPDLLEKEYGRWARRLADLLGVPLYPYADRFRSRGPGRNLSVC